MGIDWNHWNPIPRRYAPGLKWLKINPEEPVKDSRAVGQDSHRIPILSRRWREVEMARTAKMNPAWSIDVAA